MGLTVLWKCWNPDMTLGILISLLVKPLSQSVQPWSCKRWGGLVMFKKWQNVNVTLCEKFPGNRVVPVLACYLAGCSSFGNAVLHTDFEIFLISSFVFDLRNEYHYTCPYNILGKWASLIYKPARAYGFSRISQAQLHLLGYEGEPVCCMATLRQTSAALRLAKNEAGSFIDEVA